MKRLNISCTLNGKPFQASAEPRTLLLDFLRDEAGATGAKRGCNEGKCGACTVLMDGVAIKSCNALAARADGTDILTVEGLGTAEKMHPIQQAFHEKHGLQCGFCTGGMLMTTKYLIDSGIKPDPEVIRDAIHGNVCRCTGYQKIVESVVEAIKKVAEQTACDGGSKA
jgi:aerobic-type carbon monoxide dehydrogenase small subunit (CoxS/CutS family)